MKNHKKKIERMVENDLGDGVHLSSLCLLFMNDKEHRFLFKRFWRQVNTRKLAFISSYFPCNGMFVSIEEKTLLRLLTVHDFINYLESQE